MDTKQAISIAHGYAEKYEIIGCVDIGNAYAFYINYPGIAEIEPGLPIIVVDKESGAVSEMSIPPLENLDILERGTPIPI